MDHGIIFIILACLVGLWMTWGIGANDLANIMSTAMGSKAITVHQAIWIAVIFEIAGAFLGGNHVTDTIRSGIINVDALHDLHLLIYSMLSVLFAGAIWITFASYLGMPVSITNAIIGALVGVGAITLGLHAIHWQTVGYIAISWISSPAIAGVIAFLLFSAIKRSILGVDNPLHASKIYIPIYLFFVSVVLAMMTTLKAADHFHLVASGWLRLLMVIGTIILVFSLGMMLIYRIHRSARLNRHTQFVYIEAMFSVLMAFTACAMVFAHGSNDVAIAVGPIVSIVSIVWADNTMFDGGLLAGIVLFGCVGILLGLFMYGRKVIETVGSEITILTPSRAFAATLAAAGAVVVSTSTGIPVSATQTLVGAVFGVGLARGIDALNLSVMRNIFLSWIVTIPASAGLATLIFYGLKAGFG